MIFFYLISYCICVHFLLTILEMVHLFQHPHISNPNFFYMLFLNHPKFQPINHLWTYNSLITHFMYLRDTRQVHRAHDDPLHFNEIPLSLTNNKSFTSRNLICQFILLHISIILVHSLKFFIFLMRSFMIALVISFSVIGMFSINLYFFQRFPNNLILFEGYKHSLHLISLHLTQLNNKVSSLALFAFTTYFLISLS